MGGGGGVSWTVPEWPSSGGRGPGRAIDRKCSCPSLFPSRENDHLTRNQEPEDARSQSRTQVGRFRDTKDTKVTMTREIPRV